jgi:hypothetical protein
MGKHRLTAYASLPAFPVGEQTGKVIVFMGQGAGDKVGTVQPLEQTAYN